jgi:hypothetical protein
MLSLMRLTCFRSAISLGLNLLPTWNLRVDATHHGAFSAEYVYFPGVYLLVLLGSDDVHTGSMQVPKPQDRRSSSLLDLVIRVREIPGERNDVVKYILCQLPSFQTC